MRFSHPRASPGSHVPYVVHVNMTVTKSFILSVHDETGRTCYVDMTYRARLTRSAFLGQVRPDASAFGF